MKYNPKVNETIAALPGFAGLHPHQPESTIQGALRLMKTLEDWLAEITGLDAVTLQPAAGSHGELTGMYLTRAWHISRGKARKTVLIPDSAHGTNPASIVMAGFQAVNIPSDARGRIDLAALKAALNPEVAALMVTNPNTMGLFEDHIAEIAEAVHGVGGLLYMDGANMNALVGLARPGNMGFDVVHLNLHKTFSTPHGGGGPGCGPVAVTKILAPFLPVPRIKEMDGRLRWDWDCPHSIGKIHSLWELRDHGSRCGIYTLHRRRRAEERLRNRNLERELHRRETVRRLQAASRPAVHARGGVFGGQPGSERGQGG